MEFRLVCKICNKVVKEPLDHMVDHDIMDREHLVKREPLEFFNLVPSIEWVELKAKK